MRGTLNDHAVLTAIMLYRKTIATEPIKARNPAEFNALMDTPILQYLIDRHAARQRRWCSMTDAELLAATEQMLSQLEYIGVAINLMERKARTGTLDPNTLSPAQLFQVLRNTHAHFNRIQSGIVRLTDLFYQMLEERQSTQDAYLAGWEAGITDLYDTLRRYGYDDLVEVLRRGE